MGPSLGVTKREPRGMTMHQKQMCLFFNMCPKGSLKKIKFDYSLVFSWLVFSSLENILIELCLELWSAPHIHG